MRDTPAVSRLPQIPRANGYGYAFKGNPRTNACYARPSFGSFPEYLSSAVSVGLVASYSSASRVWLSSCSSLAARLSAYPLTHAQFALLQLLLKPAECTANRLQVQPAARMDPR